MRNRKPKSEEHHAARRDLRRRVGERVQMARLLLDENRTRFAAGYGRSGPTWEKWESAKALPDADVLIALCDHYGFTLDWFYRGVVAGMRDDTMWKLSRANPQLIDHGADEPAAARVVPAEPLRDPKGGAAATAIPDEPRRGRRSCRS